jgi:hypothetical protein
LSHPRLYGHWNQLDAYLTIELETFVSQRTMKLPGNRELQKNTHPRSQSVGSFVSCSIIFVMFHTIWSNWAYKECKESREKLVTATSLQVLFLHKEAYTYDRETETTSLTKEKFKRATTYW